MHNFYVKAERDGEGFSLLQLNIDNFKRINDLYGPSVGYDILINLVNVIQKNIGAKSQLIHWHSDNFIVVIPAEVTSPYEFANKACPYKICCTMLKMLYLMLKRQTKISLSHLTIVTWSCYKSDFLALNNDL